VAVLLTGQRWHAYLVVAAVVVALAVQCRRRSVDEAWVMVLSLWVLPVVILFVVSKLAAPILVLRYLVTGEIGVALLLGAGAAMLSSSVRVQGLRPILAIAVIALVVVASATQLRTTLDLRYKGDDSRALARTLTAVTRPGDQLDVIQDFNDGGFAAGVAYYLADEDFSADIERSLPSGTPTQYLRDVVATSPYRTSAVEQPTGTVWLVAFARSPKQRTAQPEGLAELVRQGCRLATRTGRRFGDIDLIEVRCGAVSSG
jgi:hypothetical protein